MSDLRRPDDEQGGAMWRTVIWFRSGAMAYGHGSYSKDRAVSHAAGLVGADNVLRVEVQRRETPPWEVFDVAVGEPPSRGLKNDSVSRKR